MEHKFEKAKKFFSSVKTTVCLWKDLWKEGSTALMRAPRTADKTSAALEIAADIAAKGREVLYVNAEQRLGNYPAVDSDNLYIFTPEYASPEDTTDYADLVFEAIEQAVTTTAIRTFVIDSISRIAALSFGRNASVAYLMKRIVALQVKCKLSVLVLADDSTKTVNNALTALAASEISEISERSILPVGSRPVLLRKRKSDNATAKEDDSQPNPGFASVATGRDPTVVSDWSDRSDMSDKSDSSPSLAGLSRRERRALLRKTTPRFDRFAGPNMKVRV